MTTHKRADQPDDVIEYDEDEEEWYPRMPKSALRSDLFNGSTTSARSVPTVTTNGRPRPIPPRASAAITSVRVKQGPPPPRKKDTEDLPRKWHPHPLLFVGLALIVAILGWIVLTSVATWVTNMENHWQYGYPRTFQCNAVVGQNDSPTHPSHFIAINLNGQVEVIEFPGGDTSHARIYTGMSIIGPDADKQPVTLSFQDVDGDGSLDMIVIAGNSRLVFLNKNGQFVKANT